MDAPVGGSGEALGPPVAMVNRVGVIPALLIIGQLAGCVAPAVDIRTEAERLGFTHHTVPGDGYRHVVLTKGETRTSPTVHVYLEGDGRPWIRSTRIARDPTPKNPLTLRLMSLDPAPGVFLGRPCYFGLSDSDRCEPRDWTHHRYSDAVVTSLAAALDRTVGDASDVVLIGHSGGGTLAMLLAERVPHVRAVVTLGGNLDVGGWARMHGHSPLHGSLDPAERPPLPAAIQQVHIVGANDRTVPPPLVEAQARRQPGARFVLVPDRAHAGCWDAIWPALLSKWVTPAANRAAPPRAPIRTGD